MLISNLRSYDHRGCLEAAVASEAVEGIMHIDTRLINVADFKFKVI